MEYPWVPTIIPVMVSRLGGEAAVREMIIQHLAQQRQVTMVELRNSLQDNESGHKVGFTKRLWVYLNNCFC